MAKPSKTITVNGENCVTTANAAERLGVTKGRVLHFIHEERLRSIQLEEDGAHYIPIADLEAFAKVKRERGRPSTKTGAKPAGKKAAKKSARKSAKK